MESLADGVQAKKGLVNWDVHFSGAWVPKPVAEAGAKIILRLAVTAKLFSAYK